VKQPKPLLSKTEIVLVVIALVAGIFAANASRSQSFEDLFTELAECPVAAPCPPLPLKDVCGLAKGYWIDVEPTNLNKIRVWPKGCGEYVEDQQIHPCMFVEIVHFSSEDLKSSIVDGSSNVDCQPVPEPGFGITLAIGGAWLLAASKRRRAQATR